MFLEHTVVELQGYERSKQIIKKEKAGVSVIKMLWKVVSSISITYTKSYFIKSKLILHSMKNYWPTFLLWTLTLYPLLIFIGYTFKNSSMVNQKVLQPKVCKQIYSINKQERQGTWLLVIFFSSSKLFLSEIYFLDSL